jgi:AraC family transcriptional regulator, L-rhamnose operon regulatory protein RhaS
MRIHLKDFGVKENLLFNITMGTIFKSFPEHDHDFSEIFIILRGSAIHIINGTRDALEAGDVYVLDAASKHSFVNVRKLDICNLQYDASRLIAWSRSLRRMQGFQALFVARPSGGDTGEYARRLRLRYHDLKHVTEMLTLIREECAQQAAGYEAAVQSYFMSMVIYLSRLFQQRASGPRHQSFIAAKVAAYIEEHFSEHVTSNFSAQIIFPPFAQINFLPVFSIVMTNFS